MTGKEFFLKCKADAIAATKDGKDYDAALVGFLQSMMGHPVTSVNRMSIGLVGADEFKDALKNAKSFEAFIDTFGREIHV